jgi:MtrB/PioB family decaheme-associated outer membrane protein
VLTLPAGYPAASTGAMPLAATLQPVELGLTLKRYDLGGSVVAGDRLTFRVSLRRDVRDGTRPLSSSFYSTAAQMAAPVDQTTDQFELAGAYVSRRLQATLGYQVSQFRNDASSLAWDNPFLPVQPGATQGRLALAPDNNFHQITGSVGYDVSPTMRASADFAVGRMTQDAAYLASTSNAVLAPSVPALPAASLDGRVDTFSGNVRLSASPTDALRINAVYSRDVRDNRTAVQSYPVVTTDLFLNPLARSNTPFGFWRDRFKLNASYRGPGTLRLSAGIDQDNQDRRYAEVVNTRETTVWGRVGYRPRDDLSLALKLAHAERNNSPYGVATWFGFAENPLLRKYNLADRQRDSVGARADVNVGENVNLGLTADYTNDDYSESLVGLQHARSTNLGADLSVALSEKTQLHAFAQGEDVRSTQAGSQYGLTADWSARNKDRFDVVGLGVKHSVILDKLVIGADLVFSRSRSNVTVAGNNDPEFPAATTSIDSVKLYANYKLNEKVTLSGSYWYEGYDAQDWHLDGVLPGTVPNLLAFGVQPPGYHVNVLRLAVRYRF